MIHQTKKNKQKIPNRVVQAGGSLPGPHLKEGVGRPSRVLHCNYSPPLGPEARDRLSENKPTKRLTERRQRDPALPPCSGPRWATCPTCSVRPFSPGPPFPFCVRFKSAAAVRRRRRGVVAAGRIFWEKDASFGDLLANLGAEQERGEAERGRGPAARPTGGRNFNLPAGIPRDPRTPLRSPARSDQALFKVTGTEASCRPSAQPLPPGSRTASLCLPFQPRCLLPPPPPPSPRDLRGSKVSCDIKPGRQIKSLVTDV